ncbi:MAG: hypothetical protein AAB610_01675 [Patescibacteria group bacterium]
MIEILRYADNYLIVFFFQPVSRLFQKKTGLNNFFLARLFLAIYATFMFSGMSRIEGIPIGAYLFPAIIVLGGLIISVEEEKLQRDGDKNDPPLGGMRRRVIFITARLIFVFAVVKFVLGYLTDFRDWSTFIYTLTRLLPLPFFLFFCACVPSGKEGNKFLEFRDKIWTKARTWLKDEFD